MHTVRQIWSKASLELRSLSTEPFLFVLRSFCQGRCHVTRKWLFDVISYVLLSSSGKVSGLNAQLHENN